MIGLRLGTFQDLGPAAGGPSSRGPRSPLHLDGRREDTALRDRTRGRVQGRAGGCDMADTGAPPTAPISILLVDDRGEDLLALEVILEEPGLRLVKASSG